ncbi:MAG: FKBP-type peptidyl-prolyl cis-trans isomerase [Niabella sp.]
MKILLFVTACMFVTVVSAQTGNKKVTSPKKPAPVVVKKDTLILQNLKDSASYAIGFTIANGMKKGFPNLNSKLIAKAVEDAFADKRVIFEESQAQEIFMAYVQKDKEEKSQKDIKEGESFLEKNKTRPGVTVTPSGLQYEVLREGTGKKPSVTDTVVCHYKGSLINSTEFDNSYDRGEPLTIAVGNVIKGWTEGLQLMSEGAKYKFYIPYQLGYGTRDLSAIPAGSALIFEVELIKVK